MWTLLKREISENWGYLLTIFLFAASSIAYAEFAKQTSKSIFNRDLIPVLGYVALCILLLGIGASRIVIDRTNGISTFFAGHLTTRGHVFTIRILMGIVLVALFYIPVLCWSLWRLPHQTLLPPNFPAGKLAGMAIFLFFLPLACYNLGLRMGQSKNKFVHLFGAICLGALLLSFAILKGFGYEGVALLVVLNLTLIYSAWRSYAAAAL
jgi:hypothetical protein